MQNKLKFVFFGTSVEAVYVLEALHEKGFVPSLVVTPPDAPVGRHQELTPPLAKKWAVDHFISSFQPEKINDEAIATLSEEDADVFVVVGYGKILPQKLIDLPKFKTINIHPSLLPLYRGPTPVQAAILNADKETGITIMTIDAEVDHGPIIIQEKYPLRGHETEPELTKILFTRGGYLLTEILPDWLAGKITPTEQEHARATYTKKIKKEDGLVELAGDPVKNYNKFRAYFHWPRTFFFKDNKRIIITEATLEDGKFIIKKVIPEGGKEVNY